MQKIIALGGSQAHVPQAIAQEARYGLSEFRIPPEFGNKLFEYQTAAVKIAAHHLNKRNGVLIGDTTMLSSGVLIGDNIITSNGVLIGDGAIFMSSSVLIGDGVLIGELQSRFGVAGRQDGAAERRPGEPFAKGLTDRFLVFDD